MKTIEVELIKILYSEPNRYSESGVNFVIAKARYVSRNEEIIVKGEMLEAVQYESYKLFGETELDKKYNELVFKFESFHVLTPMTNKGAFKYFTRYIKKIGPVASGEIVEYFGPNVIDDLINSPDRIFEVESISEKQSYEVFEHFRSNQIHNCYAIAELTALFEGFKVSKKVIDKIVRSFGSSSLEILNKNPYILTKFPRMGFDTVDEIARAKFNISVESPVRVVAAINEAMNRNSDNGNTCCVRADMEIESFKLIGVRIKSEWIDWAIRDEVIVSHTEGNNQIYQLVDHYEAERDIALNIVRITRDVFPIYLDLDLSGLEGDQLTIPGMVLNNGVSCLAGIPGSGKTYAISYLCNQIEKSIPEMVFTFCAPTGRASKRLKEMLDHHNPHNNFSCSTIHKVLKWVFSDKEADVPESIAKPKRGRSRFQFSDDDTEELPVGLYIIEESSMVDIFMAAALLRKIPSGSRVCFVGDPYQLPSIRAGSFLRDILYAGVPSIKLETPRRNAGKIVQACWQIKSGITPSPSLKLNLEANPAENWIHIEQDDPESIQKTIIALYEKSKADKFWDIQTISPQKEKDFIGCKDLNRVLSKLLNPKQIDVMENGRSGLPFTIGDKVMRTRNGIVDNLDILGNGSLYDEECDEVEWKGQSYSINRISVVNGDMGIVLGSTNINYKWYVVIEFRNPTRLCILPLSDHKIELSYANTVHKLQGSGAKCVIAVLSDLFFSGLITRELGYTMISRAEEKILTVGSIAALRNSVKRKTIDQRRTRLKDLVFSAIQ